MRFVVAQMGARRGYAVPALLERAGLLERFYTDLAGNVGLGRCLVRLGRLFGWHRAAERLANRRVPAVIKTKTTAFAGGSVWRAFMRLGSSRDPSARFRSDLSWSRKLGCAVARRGFGRASHLYSMMGEFGPAAGAAKRRALTVISEVYILPSAERIVNQEQLRYPDWEPVSPDLNLVRREFGEPDQLFRQSDFFVCPSEAVRDDVEVNIGGARNRTALVPYGIDSRWLTLPARPTRGRVLCVGTAGLRKGIHYLAKTSGILMGRGKAYEFRIVGEVTAQVARHSEARHLNFLGRVERDRVQSEYTSADVFVLPSLAEGSAESTFEALGCGLPVITTQAAGSVLRHGVEGWMVPERDPDALARAIENIVENRPRREQFSQAARRRAREYTLEQYGDRLIAALASFTA